MGWRGGLYKGIFQLTTSQGGRQVVPKSYMYKYRNFNSRPRKEVDFQLITYLLGICISTHDLARRSTNNIIYFDHNNSYFNSRPRKEVD